MLQKEKHKNETQLNLIPRLILILKSNLIYLGQSFKKLILLKPKHVTLW